MFYMFYGAYICEIRGIMLLISNIIVNFTF